MQFSCPVAEGEQAQAACFVFVQEEGAEGRAAAAGEQVQAGVFVERERQGVRVVDKSEAVVAAGKADVIDAQRVVAEQRVLGIGLLCGFYRLGDVLRGAGG